MKPFDGFHLIKYARIVSSNVGDLHSEEVLGSATRKLTLNMKTKLLSYVKQMNLYQPGPAVFSEFLNDIEEVQDGLLLFPNPNADREKSSYKEKAKVCHISNKHSKQPFEEPEGKCVERRQTFSMEMWEIQEDERRRKRTKSKRIEIVLQIKWKTWKIVLVDSAMLMFAGNLITDCYIDHTRRWNRSKMMKMPRRSLRCSQWEAVECSQSFQLPWEVGAKLWNRLFCATLELVCRLWTSVWWKR